MKNGLQLKRQAGIAILFITCSYLNGFAQDTLYVGIYNQQQIQTYNWDEVQGDAPTAIDSSPPWLGSAGLNGAAIQGEGIAPGVGFPTSGGYAFGDVADPVYIANAGAGTIEVANGSIQSGSNPIVNSTFISGLNVPANIALSPNGGVLYVAQEGAGTITEYNALTGAQLASASVVNAHDVVVNANGTVYVTGYAPGSSSTVGVVDFTANLTNEQTFVAPNSALGNGQTLTHPTGMAFDSSGNLWVANVYAKNGSVIGAGPSTENLVAEYSPTGTLLKTIESNGNELYTVFGLALGPDGNIYATSFSGDEITEINDSTGALTDFLNLASGDEPKYATWQSDQVTFTPEPKTYGLMTLGGVMLLLVHRRLKRTWLTVW
jgi:hypothetical protein